MNVSWTNFALDKLAAIYVALPLEEQREISRIVERINAELAIRGRVLGESRESDDRRIWFKDCLRIRYAVKGEEIIVTSVVYFRSKNR